MRVVLVVLAVLAAVLAAVVGMPAAAPAGAEPPSRPDLSAYPAVVPDAFVTDGEAYFQTPDGLLCAIRPNISSVGCDGRLPGTLADVNEIDLAADASMRGLRATSNPRFVKPSGTAAPVLHEGQKIVFADVECAVGRAAVTSCTKGSPVSQWMVVSPAGTGIGPRTEGLPPGFPDPTDFVTGDATYIVGQGAKNLFPVFTVDGGLTCSIIVFSGGEIGCDGPLPGVGGGENEVFIGLGVPGSVGIRRTDDPKFSTPAYPGPITRLPVGYRVRGIDSTCMAVSGGVACVGTLAGRTYGFEVTPSGVTTFGG